MKVCWYFFHLSHLCFHYKIQPFLIFAFLQRSAQPPLCPKAAFLFLVLTENLHASSIDAGVLPITFPNFSAFSLLGKVVNIMSKSSSDHVFLVLLAISYHLLLLYIYILHSLYCSQLVLHSLLSTLHTISQSPSCAFTFKYGQSSLFISLCDPILIHFLKVCWYRSVFIIKILWLFHLKYLL